MSRELERLSHSSRRTNIFLSLVTVIGLGYCLLGAFTTESDLLSAWRGVALLLLSAGIWSGTLPGYRNTFEPGTRFSKDHQPSGGQRPYAGVHL